MSSKRALRGAALCLAALCLALLVTGSAAPDGSTAAAGNSSEAQVLRAPLPDTGGAMHYAYIDAGGDFRPDEVITRGELAEFIDRALGSLEPGEYFPDAPEGIEYGKSMAALRAVGLLKPDGEGLGRPDGAVQLGELIQLLGALSGTGARAQTLSSGGAVTRAQAVKLINRALGRSADAAAADGALFPLFDDVPYGHPAYYDVFEAATEHTASPSAGGETYTWYERQSFSPGFNLLGTELYYADPETLEPLRDGYAGELYFGPDGRYASGDAVLDGYVKDVLAELLEPGMTRWEALREAYDYTRDSFTYLRRNYYLFRETGWAHDEAITMFETGRGNCYCYAAVFYYLARQLGYNCTIISGRVGTDGDPHGWVEMRLDGYWRIFDPELEMAWGERGIDYDFFNMSYAAVPWPYTK